MTFIIRRGRKPFRRDKEGKYTAIAYTTKDGRERWVSNSAVRNICLATVIIASLATGASAATYFPNLVQTLGLRGSLK
jgi:hypothetical protein